MFVLGVQQLLQQRQSLLNRGVVVHCFIFVYELRLVGIELRETHARIRFDAITFGDAGCHPTYRTAVNATFGHVNVIANDWRRLARFYQEVLGCVPVPPERDFQGTDLDAGTGLRNAHLRGMHPRLPGLGERGPTLEIFQYDEPATEVAREINRPGFGHIAFAVDDVKTAREEVLAGGGTAVGEIVTLQVATGARVTFCYVRDPEGNIVELQSWKKS